MKNDNKKVGLFFIIIIGLWVVLIFKVATAALPYNPLSGDKEARSNLSLLIPQGWAFFTKDPREPAMLLFKKEKDQYNLELTPNGSSKNLYGARRISRAKGVEMGTLHGQAQNRKWYDCADGLKGCQSMLDTLQATSIINEAYNAQICGEYILATQEPVPWAWGASFSNIEMPTKFIKINAVCIN